MKTYKIACHACGGHIEFPDGMSGQIIACPHCGLSVALAVPNADKAKPQPAAGSGGSVKLLKLIFALLMFVSIPGCMASDSHVWSAAFVACFFGGLGGFVLCRFAE